MHKKIKNQGGFTGLSVLLVLVVLGIVGFTAWYVYNSNKKINNSLSSDNSANIKLKNNTTNKNNDNEATKQSESYQLKEGWTTYKAQDIGIEISYPEEWLIETKSNATKQYWENNILLRTADFKSAENVIGSHDITSGLSLAIQYRELKGGLEAEYNNGLIGNLINQGLKLNKTKINGNDLHYFDVRYEGSEYTDFYYQIDKNKYLHFVFGAVGDKLSSDPNFNTILEIIKSIKQI